MANSYQIRGSPVDGVGTADLDLNWDKEKERKLEREIADFQIVSASKLIEEEIERDKLLFPLSVNQGNITYPVYVFPDEEEQEGDVDTEKEQPFSSLQERGPSSTPGDLPPYHFQLQQRCR